MTNRVLLIDDDTDLTEMIKDYLEKDGFIVDTAENGELGIQQVLANNYAIILLDIMMPKLNGLEVLKKIRQFNQVPILMLTAKGDDTDRIVGLELGADDYVTKPCTPRELSARIRAILRRTQTSPTLDSKTTITVGQLMLSPEQRYAELKGQALTLTSTEFNILKLLIRHAGHPVSKRILSEEALGRPLARFDRNIDVHLSNLRQKLGNITADRSYIQTVYRQGYQLIME